MIRSIAAALFATLALTGCITRADQPAAPIDQSHLAAWYGQPRALAATLLLRSSDAVGASTVVTLRLWRNADGRTRVQLTKVDVDVLAALIQPDGAFEAWAPRSGMRTAGELADPTLPPGFADIRLLLGEVCDGPLPPVLAPGTQANTLTGPADSRLDALLSVPPHSDWVVAKTLSDHAGAVVYRLQYAADKDFDGTHRATKVKVTAADGGQLAAYLTHFDTLGSISPERMRLTIPDTAKAVTPGELLEHLDQ